MNKSFFSRASLCALVIAGATLPLSAFASITIYLQYGSSGVQVVELQKFLIKKNFLQGEATGNFYGLTRRAVMSFQAANGISQTGTVGPLTRTKINAEGVLVTPEGNVVTQVEIVKVVAVNTVSTNPDCASGEYFSRLTGKPCGVAVVSSVVSNPVSHVSALDINGLSPSVSASEVGKIYQAQFFSHLPVGGKTTLEVKVKKAAKYYPISINSYNDGHVYFPSCFGHDCFNGRTFPIGVDSGIAIVAVDLEFKNTTADTVYFRSGWFSRFIVSGEHIIPKGSKVVTNITTAALERFTDSPSNYIGPMDTQTYTLWVKVPHNAHGLTLTYGANQDSNNIAYNKDNLSFSIPLTFGDLTQ